jgi:hypothetical protein
MYINWEYVEKLSKNSSGILDESIKKKKPV